QGERAAAPPLPGHHADDRRPQPGQLAQVAGDRLRLAALLGPDPGVCARGVDEREHRLPEALGQLHEPQGLAVPLGMRHAEVPVELLRGVPTLLVAEDHHRAAADPSEAADDRVVVAEHAVPVQLDEVLAQQADQVERVRPPRMPGELDAPPGRQPPEHLALEPLEPLLEPSHLGGGIGSRGPAGLLDPPLQLEQRPLERERPVQLRGGPGHANPLSRPQRARRRHRRGRPGTIPTGAARPPPAGLAQPSTVTAPGPTTASTARTNSGVGRTRRFRTRTVTAASPTARSRLSAAGPGWAWHTVRRAVRISGDSPRTATRQDPDGSASPSAAASATAGSGRISSASSLRGPPAPSTRPCTSTGAEPRSRAVA